MAKNWGYISLMKPITFLRMGIILLLLGINAPIYAKQQQDGDKQQQEKDKQQQDQNRQQQQRAQQQQQGQNGQFQQRGQQETNRSSLQARQQGGQRSVWQQDRAHNWQSEHRTWQQRGGYTGYRIPEARYSGYFGSSHTFRMHSYPLMFEGGYPRFQYEGLWFSVIDPWPEYWPDDWYDSDDLYIEYSGDGYYLYNRRYPRDRLALEVYAS